MNHHSDDSPCREEWQVTLDLVTARDVRTCTLEMFRIRYAVLDVKFAMYEQNDTSALIHKTCDEDQATRMLDETHH